jgi:hypothetical protein
MKTIIISLLLFLTVNAQNVWYVDRDATGANTGRSWADAWKYFDSTDTPTTEQFKGINWAIISPGDTIYISGGTDSTTYTPEILYGISCLSSIPNNRNYTFASGDPVILTPGRETGHNGDVYFATSADNQQNAILLQRISNIKFDGVRQYGFTFISRQDPNTSNATVATIGDGYNNDSLITFENCRFVTVGTWGVVSLNGSKTTIRNCLIETLQNSYANDNDLLTGSNQSGGRGGHIIDNNIIIYRNDNDTTDAHRDIIQLSSQGDLTEGTYTTSVISNNLLITVGTAGVGWNCLFYSENQRNLRWLLYNNIIVSEKVMSSIGGLYFGQLNNGATIQTAVVLNNTLIMKGYNNVPITAGIDTLISKNNLILIDTTTTKFYNVLAGMYKDIDYNLYAMKTDIGDMVDFGHTGIDNSYSGWQGLGYDLSSTTDLSANIIFADKYGITKASYYTASGRDLGVSLLEEYPELVAQYPDMLNDALGNPRGQGFDGKWDIGALEFQSNQSNNINVKSKIFLQGPFNTNSMNTNLSQNSLLPNTQPFNTAPWNYNGSESLSSGSNSSYVDWILVELRNSSNPSQVVSRRAAILKNDGTLLNYDGSIGVPFNNVQEGSYYVAVFHRNHLAIMSANPVALSANSQIYDFTNGMNKAFGTNPMADLGGGIFGLYAGDGNSNGGITIADRNEVWLPQNGTLGYLKGDFNLDGGVTIHDINLYWNINNGTMTQVP